MPKISYLGELLYNETMANILPETEVSEFEGRYYSTPQVGVDETESFIDKFRDTQTQNTNQIAQQTQALGTDIQSNLGGLMGGTGYWTSRFQTPATNQLTQDLRATAQAAALNQALENEQAIWKKRYQDAYRAYQKRQYDASKTPTTTGGGAQGGIDYEDTTADVYSGQGTLNVTYGDETQAGNTNRVSIVEPGSGYVYTWEYPIGSMDTSQRVLVNTDDPNYYRGADGNMYRKGTQATRNLSANTALGLQGGLGLINNLERR